MNSDQIKLDNELANVKTPTTSPEPLKYTINIEKIVTKKPKKIGLYKLEKKTKDNEDGSIEVELVGMYQTIKEIAPVLGFTYSKTFNIYQRKNKLANEIIITKIDKK